jgi:hypothetical protein
VRREYNRLCVGEQGTQAPNNHLRGGILAKAQSHRGPRQPNIERRLAVCYASGRPLYITGTHPGGAPRLLPRYRRLRNGHLVARRSMLSRTGETCSA